MMKAVSNHSTGKSIFVLRPGMYIGKLGDGSANDDGIYVLIKEISR